MVGEVRLYIEGGGDAKDSKAFLREGFSNFLRDLVTLARSKRTRWHIVACGSRNAAFDAFNTAMHQHPDAFNALLVDSEEAVATTPWAHLRVRDSWESHGISDDHCHLMTQAMEAWFAADPAALARFYGEGFQGNSIPNVQDVEQIPKDTLHGRLRTATRNTQKGEYRKIEHASKLLGLIDPATVRRVSRHCDRLFTTIESRVE